MISPAICSQEKVLSFEQVDDLKKSLESLPRESFFYENRNGRWGLQKVQPPSHRYVNPHDSWFPVSFNEAGEVIDEKITQPFSKHDQDQTIKKTVCIALKWMAEKMSWRGGTRQMAMSIMQHHNLHRGESISAIPWHRDHSNQTLVILLDDEGKWSGGNFLFKVGSEDPQIFQPKRGYGVIFSNHDTQHSLEPFVANADGVDRTILTIHEKTIC